ncbi:MAG: tRNA epoxyqueuosine(34) reductase QueG [Gammaproteobacteria bacterium]|nr:tRNA epoxyqueuosine(34) reductase QueG [Gammaproteobacteria bacterium]
MADRPQLPTAAAIEDWAQELGFQQIGITHVDLSAHEPHVREWLAKGFHGEMGYMARNLDKRLHPERLEAGTCTVISARMNYWSEAAAPLRVLERSDQAYISRYAIGRDYHKVLRRRLAKLALRINEAAHALDARFRAFTDSAPVLEKALAEHAGLGWMGKHSLMIHPEAGSWFFLGEIYTNLPLPETSTTEPNRCGACRACMNHCPTGAIVGDKVIDARRCISYITIEHRSAIPVELRPLIGNRVFGCDDCQLCCPWNRDAPTTNEADFKPRHGLDAASLVELFRWDEATFLRRTEGSALRRPGYEGWRRNLAVALGNGPPSPEAKAALREARSSASELLREHIDWALERLDAC